MSSNWSNFVEVTEPRGNHSATLLRDGRILIAGGGRFLASGSLACDPTAPRSLASVEVIGPNRDVIKPGATLLDPREAHYSALLDDGSVAVIGGLLDIG